ncbi:MAG TPA: ABC transporter substrate-binding protein [Candidatus Binatia bacterium]|nr:ABC transporter substrate-binding protein [Candidatus Binatia bacterium]
MTHSRSTFLATSGALALAASAPVRAQTSRVPLRVGMGPSDAYAEAWYAADAGFFQKAGLNVDVQGFNSGAVSTAAIVAGTLDISGTSTLPIVNAVARGIPLVIIAAAAVNTAKSPQAVMVVRKDGSVRAPKDLIGKTVGLNVLRTASELALDAWLVKNGVDAARVKVVEVLASEMGLALERGRIDAFIAGEPALSAALQGNRVYIFADPMSAIAPRYLYAAWCTSQSFAQRNPDLVKRFASAIYDTARWANRHHAETAPILAKYTKLDIADVGTMMRAEFADQLRGAELQPLLDSALKFGYLPRPVTLSELLLS